MGGATTDASITLGGGGERFSGLFVASYYEQEGIDSGEWEQSSFPAAERGPRGRQLRHPAGTFHLLRSGASREHLRVVHDARQFLRPDAQQRHDDAGVEPGRSVGGTYHDFSGADRFNFAPFNLLLTPSQRKSMFARMSFDVSDMVTLNVKGLFNNRSRATAPRPSRSSSVPRRHRRPRRHHLDLGAESVQSVRHRPGCRAATSAVVTRRPVEVGPRLFEQDVDTWYFNLGPRRHVRFRQPLQLGRELRAVRKTTPTRRSPTATTSARSSSRSAIRRSAR